MIRNVKLIAFVLVAVLAFVVANSISVPVYENTVMNDPCVQQCVVTADYSPFCGTDGNEYSTKGWLGCFEMCFIPIGMLYDGTCEEYYLMGV